MLRKSASKRNSDENPGWLVQKCTWHQLNFFLDNWENLRLHLNITGPINATAYWGDGSHLTGIAGAPDADWTISGSDMPPASPAMWASAADDENAYGIYATAASAWGTAHAGYFADGNVVVASGNMGVGTSDPARKLHVNAVMRLQPTSAHRARPAPEPRRRSVTVEEHNARLEAEKAVLRAEVDALKEAMQDQKAGD